MREPIVLPARLVAILRDDLTRSLGEAAERIAILALYAEEPELDQRLNGELWDFDAARKLLGKLRNARRRPEAAIGLTLDDHPALVSRLLSERLEKERQRIEIVEAHGGVPRQETTVEIEQFLAHLTAQVTNCARVRREEARLEGRPPVRQHPTHITVQRREPGRCG